MKHRLALLVSAFLICCVGGCGRKPHPSADAVERFVAGGFDSVTVHALSPTTREMAGGESYEDYERFLAEVSPAVFHGYPILRTAVLAGNGATELLDAIDRSMRGTAYGAKCFDPRHGVRISRGSEHLDLVICYECEFVQRWEGGTKHATDTIAASSQDEFDAALAK